MSRDVISDYMQKLEKEVQGYREVLRSLLDAPMPTGAKQRIRKILREGVEDEHIQSRQMGTPENR